MDSFIDEFASSACDLQDEIVQGGATEDIDVVGWRASAHGTAHKMHIHIRSLPVLGPPLGLNRSGSCFISYVLICPPAGL